MAIEKKIGKTTACVANETHHKERKINVRLCLKNIFNCICIYFLLALIYHGLQSLYD